MADKCARESFQADLKPGERQSLYQTVQYPLNF